MLYVDDWLREVNNGETDWLNLGASSVATLQMIWIAILLRFHSRPTSESKLSLAKTHFISFIVFSVAWFASGIILTIIGPRMCRENIRKLWGVTPCATLVTEVVLAWLLCGLNVFVALYIYRAFNGHVTGLNTNIATDPVPSSQFGPEARARVWTDDSTVPFTLLKNNGQNSTQDHSDDDVTIRGDNDTEYNLKNKLYASST
ncbi:hypothetical protein ABKN59_001432 [Abortiporus biennis]